MSHATDQAAIITRMYGPLAGKTIVDARPLSPSECESLSWQGGRHGPIAFALVLSDGTALIPSCDPEGNGPGALLLGDLVAPAAR